MIDISNKSERNFHQIFQKYGGILRKHGFSFCSRGRKRKKNIVFCIWEILNIHNLLQIHFFLKKKNNNPPLFQRQVNFVIHLIKSYFGGNLYLQIAIKARSSQRKGEIEQAKQLWQEAILCFSDLAQKEVYSLFFVYILGSFFYFWSNENSKLYGIYNLYREMRAKGSYSNKVSLVSKRFHVFPKTALYFCI